MLTTTTVHFLMIGAVIFLAGALLTAFFVLLLHARTGEVRLLRNPHSGPPQPQLQPVPVTVNVEIPQPTVIPLAYPTTHQQLVAVPADDLTTLVAAAHPSHQLTAATPADEPKEIGR